jgi:hypothetical protein
MRSDIILRAIFANYELSDHTAKRRKLSELKAQDPIAPLPPPSLIVFFTTPKLSSLKVQASE